MSWTDERVETLRRMWGEGASCSVIGLELGVTPSSIIGKAHRLHLGSHITVHRKGSAARRVVFPRAASAERGPKAEKPKAPAPLVKVSKLTGLALTRAPIVEGKRPAPVVIDYAEPSAARRVTITDLEHHHCRWPLGDPGADDFRYCGSDKADIGPYCGFHERMAYAPARERGARTAATRRDMVAV